MPPRGSGKYPRSEPLDPTKNELDAWGRRRSFPGSKTGFMEVQVWHEMTEDGEYTGKTEERERSCAPEGRRCSANIRTGNWTGNRCVKYAIKGGRVCHWHGGNLPAIKKNAQRTLALAASGAAERLVWMALKKRHVTDKDRIRALIEVLDRAGVAGKQTIEIELKPWQEMLKRVAGELPGSKADIELVEGEDYEVEDESTDDLED